MTTLDRLWALTGREAERTEQEFHEVFSDIGLQLERPLESAFDGYDATPLNSSTFAHTGGDGTHFGLMHVNGEVNEESPVVMTTPANYDVFHTIVGENLLEFLRLGCRTGYFDLEQLVYERELFIKWIDGLDHEIYSGSCYGCDMSNLDWQNKISKEIILLEKLTEEFSLKPWNDIENRLNELQEKYLSQLEIQPY